MFGAEAYAYQACGDAAEVGNALEEAEGPREGWGFGDAEDATDYVVLNGELEALGGAGGEGAALLDGAEVIRSGRAAEECGAENVGGGYSVLNGQVDAYAPDGGHGVGGIADA